MQLLLLVTYNSKDSHHSPLHLHSSSSRRNLSLSLSPCMATTHHFNYSSADHINMLGLRDVVFIAPPSSLHSQQPQQPPPISDHHHHPSFHLPSSTALGVGVSIFPVLTATPYNVVEDCGNANNNGEAGNTANFWRRCDDQSSFSKKDVLGVGEDESNRGEKPEEIGGLSSSNLRVCRDCGNRAKKECSYRRCRTCCKSRGYDCSTHVRSTWVPAARRRERQMATVGIGFGGGGGGGGVGVDGGAGAGGGGGSSGSSSGVKRPKLVDGSSNHGATNASSTSNATTPRSFDTSSCHRQDASFKQSLPGQVRAPAVFRCIRVTAISDNAAEFAYQASVSISGHVFRGFLYDQGIDEKNAFPCVSELRFGGASGTRIRDSSPITDPSNAYAASGCRRLLEAPGDE